MGADAKGAGEDAAGENRVVFAHPFFTAVPDGYFRISQHTQQPVFVIAFGGSETALSFSGIAREFAIPESDTAMLARVASGLEHVKVLRPGDTLPREILTGEASWTVEERHRAIARQRLTLQLASWFSGEEAVITDPEQLQQIADDPATRARIDAAVTAAATALGLPESERAQVLNSIDAIAEELAYIEALRDRFGKVREITDRMRLARRFLTRDKMHSDAIDRICRLTGLALKQFLDLFEQADAQTGEIVSTLRNIDAQTRFIRGLRDRLHMRLGAWDDIVPGWEALDPQRPVPGPMLLDATYRFLAPRFMPAEAWVLATKLGGGGKERKLKTAMTW